MTTTMKLEGGRKLLKKLRALEGKAARRANTKAVRAGLAPIAKEAKKQAPKGETGRLRKGIGRKTKGYKSGNAIGIVGQVKAKAAPHYHLVELGHRIVTGGTVARTRGKRTGTAGLDARGTRGAGRVVGFVEGKHFMRNAIRSQSNAAIRAFRKKMATEIVAEAKQA